MQISFFMPVDNPQTARCRVASMAFGGKDIPMCMSDTRQAAFREVKAGINAVMLFLALSGASRLSGADAISWIQVGRDAHHLATRGGLPFFWLGDTAWEMIHRLTREEIRHYLDCRSRQGFNAIQTVLLSEMEGLAVPNANGDLPFAAGHMLQPDTTEGDDPLDPEQYDYWDHAAFAVAQAADRGMILGLVAAWGEYVIPRAGGQCFDTAGQAYAYGHFLGVRFRNHGNVVWILGGDRHPDERPDGLAIWRAMAEGIADGVNGEDEPDGRSDFSTTCMTHHAFGSSSIWFHLDPWIDFHMWGSYHSDFSIPRAWEQAGRDWALPDPKPTLNGEPAYENHPVNWIRDNGRFTSTDSRQIAYWSVFSGACGHTYGCHDVWQFYEPGRKPVTDAEKPWKEAILLPGAAQMVFLKRLMESRPLFGRVPDQQLIAGGTGSGSGHAVATRGQGFAFIYIPTGQPVTVRMELLQWKKMKAWWYDPRNGASVLIGIYDQTGPSSFHPPGVSKELEWLRTGRGCDWVLVLDDDQAGYGVPGKGPCCPE